MVRKELQPDHRIFTLKCGRQFGAHKHSCLFCKHNTDIFYDWQGIYALVCDIEWSDDQDEHITKSFKGECELWEEG